MTNESYGRWFNAEFCIACDKFLTEHQVMYSAGRCPLCGHKEPWTGTVVDTRERAVRHVYRRGPWYWPFVRRVRTEFRRDRDVHGLF